MSQHGQVARLQGGPAGAAEPSLAELLDPVALEARLVEARARRMEAIARRRAAAESGPAASGESSGSAPGEAPAAIALRPPPRQPEIPTSEAEAAPSPEAGQTTITPSAQPGIRRAAPERGTVALPMRRPLTEPGLRGGPERPAPPRAAQGRPPAAQPAGDIRSVPRAEPGQQTPARLPLPAPPPRIGPATDPRVNPGHPADRRPVQPLHAPARAVPAVSTGLAAPQAGPGRSALLLGATFAAGMAGAVAALIFGPPVLRSWMTERSAPATPAAPGVETAGIRAPDPVAPNRAGATGGSTSATVAGDVPAGPLARTAGAPVAGDAVPLGPVLPRAATGAPPPAPALPAAGHPPEHPTALARAGQPAEPEMLLAAPLAAESAPVLSAEPFSSALRLAPRFGGPAGLPAGLVRASLQLPVAPVVAVARYETTPAAAVTAPPLMTAAATPDRSRQTGVRSGEPRTQRQLPRLPAGQSDDAESVARIVLERTVEGMLRDRLGQN